MHSLKEELHQIFEESQNLGEGTLKLIDWLDKATRSSLSNCAIAPTFGL
ncbi:MAG: hypothetical protein RIC07_26665 [Coleofasciculus sp. E1-EBD-02]